MRIMMLENSGRLYTSQVHLVLGDASRMEDVNTLVDVGQDPAILTDLGRGPTGVGKWAVEQVVLTHGHSDHCALLPRIREEYYPANIAGVDGGLHDGDTIGMGDADFRKRPHCRTQQRLDLLIQPARRRALSRRHTATDYVARGSDEAGFLAAVDMLCANEVRRIYFGHGAPLTERCNERLRESQRMAAGRWNSVEPERVNQLASAKA